MELDLGKALGATDEPFGQRLTLYVPNKDSDGNVLANHIAWCKEAQELLTEIGKGATAFPPVDGTWRKPDGSDLWEQTKIIFTYVDPDRMASNLPRLREFFIASDERPIKGRLCLSLTANSGPSTNMIRPKDEVVFNGRFGRFVKHKTPPARGKVIMAKKIEIVGAKPKKIEITDKTKRRIEPTEVAAALGANLVGVQSAENLDMIGLAELGTQLLSRLRSSGGRPALDDATEICRVPLSAADINTLEGMVEDIEKSSGAKPSVGQLVSVIVRAYLNSPPSQTEPSLGMGENEPVSRSVLRQFVEEQLTPLREKVHRLEQDLLAAKAAPRART